MKTEITMPQPFLFLVYPNYIFWFCCDEMEEMMRTKEELLLSLLPDHAKKIGEKHRKSGQKNKERENGNKSKKPTR